MIALVGIAAFFLVGLVVSWRLLGLWRETKQLPELTAALGLLGIGPLGFCVLMTGKVVFAGTPWMPLIRGAGLMVQAFGFVSAIVFTWKVFRPRQRWAAVLAGVLGVSVVISGLGMAFVPKQLPNPGLIWHVGQALKLTCLGWAATEAFLYWRVSHKRVAMGFADPLLSASFLMWSVGLAAGAMGFLLIYVATLSVEPGESLSTLVQLLMSTCGMVSASALYVSFLPPTFYIRFVEARNPGTAG